MDEELLAHYWCKWLSEKPHCKFFPQYEWWLHYSLIDARPCLLGFPNLQPVAHLEIPEAMHS